MKLLHGRPEFIGKPQRSPLDSCEPYLLLRTTIASGKMKPREVRGLELTEADAKEFGVKHVGRFVRDHLNRFLKKTGLASDYWVEWRTMTNGNQYVGVVYEPPMTQTAPKRKKQQEAAS